MVAPAAMRITAPSPISAVLSATAASLAGASLPRWAASVGSPLDSASASEPTVSPGSKAGNVGQFGDERAVDKHQPARFDVAEQGAGRLRPRLGGGIGRRRERLGVAHQRAQIGVFPVLDAPVRQAGLGEHVERRRALRRDRAIAGQPPARLRQKPAPARSRPRS